MNGLDAGKFYAWIDKMPGSHNTLHVVGVVNNTDTNVYSYLVEAVPQGINPNILILDLKQMKKPGGAGFVILPQVVTFTKPTSRDYETVTIRSSSGNIDISVEIVH